MGSQERMMAKEIWKYTVEAGDFSVGMPKGAQVLNVQLQGELVQMWALVDPAAETVTRNFVTFGTGHSISKPDELIYIGTFQVNASLVFHLFEKDGLPF